MTALAVLLACVAAAQAVLGAGVALRLLRTVGGRRVESAPAPRGTRISVVLPVRDEAARIDRCLEALSATGREVAEILVVDGGSRDATRTRARAWACRDGRVRLLAAGPAPDDWNGKAFGLHAGCEAADPRSDWILTVDADVRVRPELPASLVAHASCEEVPILSAAVRQRLPDAGQGLLHPALLTTLVVRFGIPGHASRDPARVQANGQCMLARHDLIDRKRPFAAVRGSLCEDVSAARHLARRGARIGFYEVGDLAEVTMYASAGELLRNWPRSLPLRDDGPAPTPRRVARGWAEVVAVQGLLAPMLAAGAIGAAGAGGAAAAAASFTLAVNGALAALRLGLLAGTARAYVRRPATYWLSPLADVSAAALLVVHGLRRRHRWRGRLYERRPDGGLRLVGEDE